MDFQKKLKTRRIVAISYIVLGLILILVDLVTHSADYFYFSFGIVMVCMGILRLIRHHRITKDEKTIRKQELAESDERTRMIADRARSWTFTLSVTMAGIIVLVLSLLGYHDEALPFTWFICGMVTIYWVCYVIIRKKY